MEENPAPGSLCPYCKNQVDKMAFFCQTCGKKIRDKAPGTGAGAQLVLYAMAIILPPLNIPLSFKYLRAADPKAKRIGWISLILMVIALIVITWWTIGLVNDVNRQVEQEMSKYLGF